MMSPLGLHRLVMCWLQVWAETVTAQLKSTFQMYLLRVRSMQRKHPRSNGAWKIENTTPTRLL